MAASPCGGRRPPCRWQSDAGNPSRHRPGEGAPAPPPAGPPARAGRRDTSPLPCEPRLQPRPGRPAASEVAAEGRQSRTARGPSSRHPRPAALSRRHALARGWAPGVTAWPGGWRGVGRARLLTEPGKAAGRAPGQRTSPGPPAAGGWTPLSKPASDLRGEASQRLRSQHTGAGRALGVVLTRKLLTNFIYIH